jgi:hypothetical protein
MPFPENIRRYTYAKTPPVVQEGNGMVVFTEGLIVIVLRWTARAIGIGLMGLAVAFAIGEGAPNPLRGSIPERLLTLGLLTMIVGQLLAWKWEGIGALLILGGLCLFAVVNCGVSLNIVFGAWLATGLLYLMSWWRTS